MYDETTAKHYAAYRPPIHEIILKRVLASSGKPRTGLDIGCGTGRSSRALKTYCDLVVGLDPGEAMIRKAEWFKGVLYLNATGEQIPLAGNLIDIVTIAGSLNYIDQGMLVSELKRVCRADAQVVVYDFKVDLSNVETLLEFEPVNTTFDYDHAASLCGHSEVREVIVIEDVLMLDLNPFEVAHLLLSEKARFEALHYKYQVADLFDSLRNDIETRGLVLPVKADIYYSVYALQ